MRPRAGSLTSRLALRVWTGAQDPVTGQQTENQTTYAFRHASITPVYGSERFTGTGDVGVLSVKILLAYDAETKNLSSDFEAVDVDTYKVYRVISATNVNNENRSIELLAEYVSRDPAEAIAWPT